ncbi:MAG: IPTL-CTERM sorting domain-containing protein [Rhodanobacteraceae bacterium]|nr:IPTL-CTERM sorting domain-containing protein [Rhodanobacteraceae bacterium]
MGSLATGASAQFTVGGHVADVPFQLGPQPTPRGTCTVTNLTTVLDTTAPAADPAYAAITGTQTGRILRNGTTSTCAAPKANPGANDTSVVRQFDRYRFTPASNSCITVSLTQPATTLFVYASSSFDPAAPTTGYLADAGSSAASTSFSLNVAAGVPYDVVVHEVNAGGGVGAAYTLDVSSDAPCGAGADLAVVLADTPDPVAAGSNISYTATLTNTGPGDATNASVSLPVPAGTSFVSATADGGGSCTNVSPITCSWAGTTANGAVRTATIVVSVPANAVSNTLINAVVTAASDTPDSDPADNTSTTGTAVITTADLSMSLSDTPDPVTAGTQLSYTATLTNGGPSDAQNARFSVDIPAGTSLVAATPVGGSCTGSTTVTCTWAGATAPGVNRSAAIVVAVPANVVDGSFLDASASAASDTSDLAGGNNLANATTSVIASADLSISLTDTPDPVIAGTQLTYVATLTNAGPSDAQDAMITLPLPAGTSFVSAAASAGGSCNAASPVVCTWAGATTTADTRTATIVALVSPSQTANLSATATASSSTADPIGGNDSATATTAVQVQADLSITLADAPDPVTAGTQLTYTAVVTNAGPSDATAVVVNLPTPTGTSLVSGTVSGGGSCAAGISCSISGSMAPGSSRTLTITVLVAPAVLDSTVIDATATVSAGSPDPNGANNSASTTTTVVAVADLVIGLTSSAAQVLINVPVTFTATSINNGPSDAQDVSVTITLTPDFRYSSHTAAGASCTTPQVGNTGAIVCTWAGATAPGVTRTLTVVAFSNNEGNTAVNASTASPTTDPVADNNLGSLSVVVGYPFNEIPTLSQYGLVLLGLLMGLIGFAAARRQG